MTVHVHDVAEVCNVAAGLSTRSQKDSTASVPSRKVARPAACRVRSAVIG